MKKKFRKLIPEKSKNNWGWFWKKPAQKLHFYLSYEKSTIAITHCGRISQKSDLVDIRNLPKCEYCLYIEKERKSIVEMENE